MKRTFGMGLLVASGVWLAAAGLAGLSPTEDGCCGSAAPGAADEAPERVGGHGTQEGPLLRSPEPLRVEHEALHRNLRAALESGGATAEAARAVVEVLRPHFLHEEEIAMPPLALLKPLAAGEAIPPDRLEAACRMTRELERDLPGMLAEHEAIKAALEDLALAARAEGKAAHAEFADALVVHARTEKEILYPAALLVGQKIRAERCPGACGVEGAKERPE